VIDSARLNPARAGHAKGTSRAVSAGARCLVIGAGEAGRSIARDLKRSPEYGLRPVGFLDDNPTAKRVGGLPVIGPLSSLEASLRRLDIGVVVVAIPSLPHRSIKSLVESAAAVGAQVRYLPTFLAALEREARVSDLRRLQVGSLIGREEMRVVQLSSRTIVADRRVLVTGAGGSIGSELCRQIRAFGASDLYLLDHDESNLQGLQLELTGQSLLDTSDTIIADIRDGVRIRQLFMELRPEIVFHAAAHKHLPLLERHPCEGVKTNVLGTINLVEAAEASGVERLILISTDKAADPTSILGSTKRVAELILMQAAAAQRSKTRFASVRFGNVLGSRGSLLSILSRQIENGDSITITHPDVTRFFMTIEEAVGLVVEAAGMATKGEVYVLDMGKPVRILDLVSSYANQMHCAPEALTYRFTGLRPGEKLNEALFGGEEDCVATVHPKIWAATQRVGIEPDFDERVARLLTAAEENAAGDVRSELARILCGSSLHEVEDKTFAAPYPDGF
jgi:FlaA1/EpsC-like NDP-sugar epimerase